MAVSNASEEIRLEPSSNFTTKPNNTHPPAHKHNNNVTTSPFSELIDGVRMVVVRESYDAVTTQKWCRTATEEENLYLIGRGKPGTGGIEIGRVHLRLRVTALQGLQRDVVTGATRKKFGQTEADVPIQVVLWSPPVEDTRFVETAALTVERLLPLQTAVVAVAGDLLGTKGVVVGHGTATNANDKRSLHNKRVVDVEFRIHQPEPPFGYTSANEVHEEYYCSKDLCKTLQLSASVLGKIVGSLKVGEGRNATDIGLNLRRNGQYQLLGYAHKVDMSAANGQKSARKVWNNSSDTVQVIGALSNDSSASALNEQAEQEGCYWEYTVDAASLLFEYKIRFPALFRNLEKLPHQAVYDAGDLFGAQGEEAVAAVMEWMKAQAFFSLPRSPFSTLSLSKYGFIVVVVVIIATFCCCWLFCGCRVSMLPEEITCSRATITNATPHHINHNTTDKPSPLSRKPPTFSLKPRSVMQP